MRRQFLVLLVCTFLTSAGGAASFSASAQSGSVDRATLIKQKGDAVRHAVRGLRRKFDKFLIYYIWDGYLNGQTNILSKHLLEGKISKTEYKRTYQEIIRQLEKMARAYKKLGDRSDERSVKKAIKDIQRHMNYMLKDASSRRSGYSKVSRYDTFGASDYASQRRGASSGYSYSWGDGYSSYSSNDDWFY